MELSGTAYAATALRALLDQSVAGVFAVGPDRRLRFINARFAELHGYTPEEMIGRDFSDFVADSDLEARRAIFASLIAGETPSTQQLGMYKRNDGTTFQLLTQVTRAEFRDGLLAVGIGVDVSDRSNAVRALQVADRALSVLQEAGSALIRAGSEADLLQEICDIAVRSGYVSAWVGKMQHDDEQRFVPIAAAGARTEFLLQTTLTWAARDSGLGPAATAARTGVPVVLQNIDENPPVARMREFAREVGFRSGAGLPLVVDGVTEGAIAIYAEQPNAFGTGELDLLTRLSADLTFGISALRKSQALQEAQRRSREHAARLEALWHLVSGPASGEELWVSMIDAAASALRPGVPFVGSLNRIDGESIVAEAAAATANFPGGSEALGDLRTGLSIPLAGTAIERVLESGLGTRTYRDAQAELPGSRLRSLDLHGVIGSTFRAGASTYVFWFASPQEIVWEPEDTAYVEVLAAFIGGQLRDRWQYERLRYHQMYDILTGVLNRSQFRSQMLQAAFETPAPYAIMSLDIKGLHDVNEAHGTTIGDALLVEVAAGLQERATGNELVGRLGGDVFGIYLPGNASVDAVYERAREFARRFEEPFSIGARDGKGFIPLTASFGLAYAAAGNEGVDRILSHSAIALSAAKKRGPGTILFHEPGIDA